MTRVEDDMLQVTISLSSGATCRSCAAVQNALQRMQDLPAQSFFQLVSDSASTKTSERRSLPATHGSS